MKRFFVHIPKNGGSALRFWAKSGDYTEMMCNFWQNYDSLRYSKEEIDFALSSHGWDRNVGHARVTDFIEGYLDDYQTFCIIRNPWDRVVTQFKYMMYRSRKFGIETYGVSCLNDYLNLHERFDGVRLNWLNASTSFFCQKDYIDDKTHCLRFEFYNEDTKNYLGLDQPLHRINRTRGKRSYTEYYDDNLIQKVADMYKDDIDHFDFDFDTPARKNIYYAI